MAFVEVKQVSKIYGHRASLVHALNQVSFTIDKGEFVGIMGPSGAGKTTLLNVMSTIDQPSSGQVLLNGENVSRLHDQQLAEFRRQQLGFIFQDFNLLDALTVRENLILPLSLDKTAYTVIQTRLQHIAQILGLEQLLDRYPNELSIGQKQRVACGRAIITAPELLFADEPTGSLDSKSATELLQYLSQLNDTDQTTIMMVTHDAFTASYCKRILFIKDGQIFAELIRQGDRKQFFNDIINMQATIGGGRIAR
ncbi:hypothetical protein IV38_GL001428 [Lactobacillus selangorensis]|uniref:ABC transporter domain-containing protein n=1 Tax=Lactobacillus selangorensis TaxID=81857 RepID=A0A0R2FTE3_9LACO|nr:ABC transporter ATP-binding protein [Lactobacillus selangorensis]KRN28428.1 hypothetical protein IV38_GL001428 [Lactobacillus selangorensis]KRN31929.1 hypothetical protein IV40_GL001215 [Lactobacillus selangorensis]